MEFVQSNHLTPQRIFLFNKKGVRMSKLILPSNAYKYNNCYVTTFNLKLKQIKYNIIHSWGSTAPKSRE